MVVRPQSTGPPPLLAPLEPHLKLRPVTFAGERKGKRSSPFRPGALRSPFSSDLRPRSEEEVEENGRGNPRT